MQSCMVCWRVVGGKQNEMPFHPYRQLRFKQEVFMVCIDCSALLFYFLLSRWSFDMSENQPSKLLIVPVLEFLTAEMESALEQEHE